jgi:fluoroacetyl-CoA thioesterase
MILKFSKGDRKTHVFQVSPRDTARFEAGEVHSVCSTFVLAREMEWAGRLFVLEMKEAE